KREGKYKGREKTYHAKHPRLQQALQLYGQGHLTIAQIREETGVSKSTLYRQIRALSVRERT
ncbi:helix-turn-helix domain-containing protein, partial [Bacillus cereus]|uniref:helix-turn-helix domain-containing protein n=1 Tax=Bacillus cereus TaxID=1396 RepID=UPI0011502FE3